MADGFDRWRDILAADVKTLQEGDLVDRWQLGVEANRIAANPVFQFLLASVKDQYISAMTGPQGESADALRSIRAGLRNIDVISDTLADIVMRADSARDRYDRENQQ